MPDEIKQESASIEISNTLNNSMRWVLKQIKAIIGESDKTVHERLDAIEREIKSLKKGAAK